MRHYWAALFAFLSASCHAISFLSFDARTVATGGAGAMTGIAGPAPNSNPCVWDSGVSRFAGGVFIGARVIDREHFISALENLRTVEQQTRIEQQLRAARNDLKNNTLESHQLRALSHAADEIITSFNTLPDKPLRVAAAAGLFAGNRNESFVVSAFTNQYTVLGAVVKNDPGDIRVAERLSDATLTIADLLDSAQRLEESANAVDWSRFEDLIRSSIDARRLHPDLINIASRPDIVELRASLEDFIGDLQAVDEHIDLADLAYTVAVANFQGLPEVLDVRNIHLEDYLRYPVPDTLHSEIIYRGGEVAEAGMNVSLPIAALPGFAIGLNLKEVQFSTIAFKQPVAEFDIEAYRDDSTRLDYRYWNMDLGAQYQLNSNWRFGAAVKGIIPKSLKSRLDDNINIRPLVRTGISYQNRNFKLALDADITKNEPLGFDPDKQYLSIGGEVYLFAQTFRYGYRYNHVEEEGLPALGLGLRWGPAILDIAATYARRSPETGASAQLGFFF